MNEVRINKSSQNENSRRKLQNSFDKGVKTSSSIDRDWKIARIESESVKNTPCGVEGILSSFDSFRAVVEVMAQKTNSGRFRCGGDLFLLVVDGVLKIEKVLEDGSTSEKIIGPKMTISISKDEIFSISSLGWSQFLRVESKGFENSERLTDPFETDEQIPENVTPSPLAIRSAQASALKTQDQINDYKRNIARLVAQDKNKNRPNRSVKKVNAAGMPTE